MTIQLAVAILAPALAFAAAQLEAIKAEPKLERRSQKALDFAGERWDAARDAYRKGDGEGLETALADIQEAVELSYTSLRATGKNPRKNFKHYKRAEIATRQMVRRMETFRDEMSYLDRERLDPAIKTVHRVHQDLLHAIMGGKK
ncbi:MAG: hypothetical protein KIT09_00125 [Bryobacteraceae bacterium]|nr:hypothetical protein [Bryobacteraceae bacterium]